MFLFNLILVCDQPGCSRRITGELWEEKTDLRKRARTEHGWYGVGRVIYCNDCKHIKYPTLSKLNQL